MKKINFWKKFLICENQTNFRQNENSAVDENERRYREGKDRTVRAGRNRKAKAAVAKELVSDAATRPATRIGSGRAISSLRTDSTSHSVCELLFVLRLLHKLTVLLGTSVSFAYTLDETIYSDCLKLFFVEKNLKSMINEKVVLKFFRLAHARFSFKPTA